MRRLGRVLGIASKLALVAVVGSGGGCAAPDPLAPRDPRDRNADGVVGFTDLGQTPRPGAPYEPPGPDPEWSLDEHLDRQDPDWKRENRDRLPP